MNAEVADQIFRFARWDVCLMAGTVGFAVGLLWLCKYVDLARRRISAFIDFVWTSMSAIGIVSALLVFGDLTWQAKSEHHTDQLHLAWDKLASIDGAKLVALNCANGQPAADALLIVTLESKAVDLPCIRASQILHWRAVEDVSISKISRSCPARDLKFSTRDYAWTNDRFLGASCLGTTECHRARCEQERAVVQILGATDTKASKSMVADSTLSAYRSSLQDASSLSMHDIYEQTHPIKYTIAFYTLVPFWAFLLGLRLARPAAELIDPTQGVKFCASGRVVKSPTPALPPQVDAEPEPEPEPLAKASPATQSGATDDAVPDMVSVPQTEAQP